jgi:hypothetical protein
LKDLVQRQLRRLFADPERMRADHDDLARGRARKSRAGTKFHSESLGLKEASSFLSSRRTYDDEVHSPTVTSAPENMRAVAKS